LPGFISIEQLLWAIPIVPFLAFMLIAVLTFKNRKVSHSLALTGAGFSFVASLVVIWKALQIPELAKNHYPARSTGFLQEIPGSFWVYRWIR